MCGECGAHYRRVTWTAGGEKRIVWRCGNRLDYGKRVCKHSPTIAEEDLHRAVVKSLNTMLVNKTTLHELLKGSMMALLGANRSEMQIGKLSNEIALLNQEMFAVIRDEVENRSDNREIEQKCAKIHRKISQLKTELQNAKTKKQAVDAGNGRIRAVCEALDDMEQEFTEYNDTVVRRLISRIRVVSAEKLICTYCGSLDLEQGL